MPECAEIKIMTEYINDSAKGRSFVSMNKSPETKVKCDVWGSGLWPFTIEAKHRGKEMILNLGDKMLQASMGMSGHWRLVPISEIPKHSHLRFESDDNMALCLVDVRRFAKWNWTDGWSSKRGPCIMTEPEEFKSHIGNNIHRKIFDKPISELLMNQAMFNGVGNYLRAEMLDRVDCSPFTDARTYIQSNPEFLDLVTEVVWESYYAGGGQLKDWSNPYLTGYGIGRINEKRKQDAFASFRNWLECYQKKVNIVDGTKRRFWFDSKWIN